MKHRQWLVGWMLVLGLLGAGTWAQTIEVPLNYERYPDNEEEYQFRPFGHTLLEMQTSLPEGEWKLPDRNSTQPLYAWLTIGEHKRLLLLDQSRKGARFYDRLYFDANANRDLTDDPVVNTQDVDVGNSRQFRASFPAMDIESISGGIPTPYSLVMHFRYWSEEPLSWGSRLRSFFTDKTTSNKPINLEQLRAYAVPNCMYTAKLKMGKTSYRIYLGDTNVNGQFDDWGKISSEESNPEDPISAEGDTFYLVEKDTTLNYYDQLPLGKYLHLKDTLYAVNIAAADKKITLSPVTEGVATIELPTPVHRISLIGAEAGVMSCLTGKTVLAPPGTYRLLKYMLFRDEPEGARWRLSATGAWNSAPITATAGTTTACAIGEPFHPTAIVPKWSIRTENQGISEARLQLVILGVNKEIVSDLECVSNADKSKVPMTQYNQPKEPTFKILKPDGEMVFQGSFEYG